MSVIKNVKKKKGKKKEKKEQCDQSSGGVVLSVLNVVKIPPNQQEGTETGKESI